MLQAFVLDCCRFGFWVGFFLNRLLQFWEYVLILFACLERGEVI